MTKITDLFAVFDKVSWITIKKQGSLVDIQKHKGTIDEIVGNEAMVKMAGRKHRKRVSLYELTNETRPYKPEPLLDIHNKM